MVLMIPFVLMPAEWFQGAQAWPKGMSHADRLKEEK